MLEKKKVTLQADSQGKDDSAKFSFVWLTDLAHGNTAGLYKGDYDIYDFFLKNRRALEKSFIFFMGDHGPRFGSFQPKSMFTDLNFKRFDSNPRGSSLLREFERGVNRTCKTLPIPFQFCMCQYEKKTITVTNLDSG
ncbi:hypothetical protein TELCIR_02350 [Teladorsagia circumcincta]|uniref:Uncharacterized protein n=1 Tax=Teladorsagia circumcincta TaxID=45464 RepID=A0A2G9UZB2_TELCI|nr:hypothetical protein TELCIR_02350 [Teladorsagia circumcincta]